MPPASPTNKAPRPHLANLPRDLHNGLVPLLNHRLVELQRVLHAQQLLLALLFQQRPPLGIRTSRLRQLLLLRRCGCGRAAGGPRQRGRLLGLGALHQPLAGAQQALEVTQQLLGGGGVAGGVPRRRRPELLRQPLEAGAALSDAAPQLRGVLRRAQPPHIVAQAVEGGDGAELDALELRGGRRRVAAASRRQRPRLPAALQGGGERVWLKQQAGSVRGVGWGGRCGLWGRQGAPQCAAP